MTGWQGGSVPLRAWGSPANVTGQGKAARRDSRDGEEESTQTHSRADPADAVRDRLHHRDGHFRPDRSWRAKGRSRPDARFHYRRTGLHRRGALLRRDRLDDPGRRLRLYLFLRHHGRIARLDRGLGADPRIRHRRSGGVGRLVGLFRWNDPERILRDRAPAMAGGRAAGAWRRTGRLHQFAGDGDSAAGHLAFDDRHQ